MGHVQFNLIRLHSFTAMRSSIVVAAIWLHEYFPSTSTACASKVDDINARFAAGQVSNNLADTGLLIHSGFGKSKGWIPWGPGKWSDRMSTAITSSKLAHASG